MRTHGVARWLVLILSLLYITWIQTSLNSCDRSQRQNSATATMIFTCHTWRFVAATCRGDMSQRFVVSSVWAFILLGGERHCESWVSCPRTQHNDPDEGSNPDRSLWEQTHWPLGHYTSHKEQGTCWPADNSGNHADLWRITICRSTMLWLNSTWYSSLLQNMKCPSWTQVKQQKWCSYRTDNGKCTNVTSQRSHVG